MTINPLEYIKKKNYIERIEMHMDHAAHTPDVPNGKWYETNEKPLKLKPKKIKKTYNVKIIGNIYDSQQSKEQSYSRGHNSV